MSGDLPRTSDDDRLDEQGMESFPASDPPAPPNVIGPVIDPENDLPPEEQVEAPHETIRDWRGEFPLRGS
ncbi:hypothetical protein [Roseomonas sp. BN140053]|uniref:hypothetical protein n=1 Tax=Roseomonas sp. BN140053 TaxID=3391898 RepID=UPI0039ECE840